jgi:hypothetical protein
LALFGAPSSMNSLLLLWPPFIDQAASAPLSNGRR